MFLTRLTPVKAIVIGSAGSLLLGWAAIQEYCYPHEFAKAGLALYNGTITRCEDIDEGKGSHTLQFWIKDEPLPFRCFSGLYPNRFDPSALQYLSRGVAVTVGVPLSERERPRRDWSQGQRFRLITYLRIGDSVALTLESYNQWSRENARTGMILIPSMLLGSLALVAWGIRRRAQ